MNAEYIAERAAVSAMTGEDSGAVYLARRDPVRPAPAHMAAVRQPD